MYNITLAPYEQVRAIVMFENNADQASFSIISQFRWRNYDEVTEYNYITEYVDPSTSMWVFSTVAAFLAGLLLAYVIAKLTFLKS